MMSCIAFLYIARGSAGEVRSMLCLLARLPGLRDCVAGVSRSFVHEHREHFATVGSLDRIDQGFRLQRHSISERRRPGRASEDERRREAFLARLQQIQDEAKRSSADPDHSESQ